MLTPKKGSQQVCAYHDSVKLHQLYQEQVRFFPSSVFFKEKVLEEVNELIEAVGEGSNTIHEAADVLYHLMMYLEANNVKIEEIMEELSSRKK